MVDPFSLWYVKMALYSAFAAVGGFMGHLVRQIHKDEPIRWGVAFVMAMASGFVGILVLFACQAMNMSIEWTGMIVGVCGWLGAETTIAMLENVVRKRLGIDGDPDDHKQS